MRCTYAVGRTGEISSVDSDEFGSGVLMRLHEHKERKITYGSLKHTEEKHKSK